MENYIIEANFSNFSLKISDLICEDSLHFSFKIAIKTSKFTTSYVFNEMIYWQLPFMSKKNMLDIYDECATDCKCKLNFEKFELIIKDDTKSNITTIKLNNDSDQEKLSDFLIELNSLCELNFYKGKK